MGRPYRYFPRKRGSLRTLPYVVQATTNSGAGPQTSIVKAFTNNVNAGNSILVAIQFNANTNRVTTITDTLGNSYFFIGEYDDATTGQYLALYAAGDSLGGANTVTVNINASAGGNIVIYEIANLKNPVGNLLDVKTTGDQANNATITASSLTTTVLDDFVIALAGNKSAVATFTVGTPGNDFQTSSTAVSHFAVEDNVVGGPQASVMSVGQSIAAQAGIVVFALRSRSTVYDSPRSEPSTYKHPTEQPQRRNTRKLQRQMPNYSRRIPFFPTATNSSTLTGQIRVALNPAIQDGYAEPIQQPQRKNIQKLQRQQPNPGRVKPPPSISAATITGQIRITLNPGTMAGHTQPPNQPLSRRLYDKRRQQPWPGREPVPPLIRSSNITGQIRISSNPATNNAGWVQPTQLLGRKRIPKRQQPAYPTRRYLISVSNQSTITGQLRVALNPALSDGYAEPIQQPLRHRWLKRLQYPRTLISPVALIITPSSTINGQIRVAINPATNPEGWKQPVNQPLDKRIPKRQQPFAIENRRFLVTSYGLSATLGGQIRVSTNPALQPVWKQPVNQQAAANRRKYQRQQPAAERRWLLVTSYGLNSTITGQLRVSANPALNPSIWKQPTNQLPNRRIPKRQMPNSAHMRPLVTSTTVATITGQVRIALNPATGDDWQRPVNQQEAANRRRYQRQQPFAIENRRFLVTLVLNSTITGQIRIAANPSTNVGIYKQPSNELPRSRTPKRQMPQYPTRRFLVTVANTATITGQIRISTNPAFKPLWKRPVEQPLRKRVPKRLQVNRTAITFVTVTRTATITGRIRVSGNPARNPGMFRQLTNQLPVRRIPKRMQVNRNIAASTGPHAIYVFDVGKPTILSQRDTATPLRSLPATDFETTKPTNLTEGQDDKGIQLSNQSTSTIL